MYSILRSIPRARTLVHARNVLQKNSVIQNLTPSTRSSSSSSSVFIPSSTFSRFFSSIPSDKDPSSKPTNEQTPTNVAPNNENPLLNNPAVTNASTTMNATTTTTPIPTSENINTNPPLPQNVELSANQIVEKIRELLKIQQQQPVISGEVLKEITENLKSLQKWGTPERPFTTKVMDGPLWKLFLPYVLLALLFFYFTSTKSIFPEMFNSAWGPVGETNVKLDDVKGCDEAKEQILDLLDYLQTPQKYTVNNVKMPKGVLFVGPPGTGKTLLAKALAGEAGVPFYYASASQFEEVFVGLGARRIRSLFAEAKKAAPCIIFIDEIDAIGSRQAGRVSETKQTINQLLVELDGFEANEGVIIIAATNFPEMLDTALVRPGRFDRLVHLDLPERKARKEIIDLYLSGRQEHDVDTDTLARATPGFSGADLFNMVNWAAIETTKQNKNKISMTALANAKDSVMMGAERRSVVMSEAAKKICSYHEGGHALVALYTEGANPIHKATLIPRGQALGMVTQLESDEHLHTHQELLASMDVAMGGRAAEDIIFGPKQITPGASSDFEHVYSIASRMVINYGMSEKVGRINLGSKENQKRLSPDVRSIIDSEVKRLSDESYQRSKKVLEDHLEELHRLATALQEYESLDLEEIKQIVKGKPLTKKTRVELDKERQTKLLEKSNEELPEVWPRTNRERTVNLR